MSRTRVLLLLLLLCTSTYAFRVQPALSVVVRGGSSDSSSDDDDSSDFVEEEESISSFAAIETSDAESDAEEEEVKLDTKLAASAVKASTKTEVKKVQAKTTKTKKAVSASLRKKSSSFVPYILKATLNPFTLWSMTKAYWQSLFQLDYIKNEDSSQELRSALEEKAKRAPTTNTNRGKRKMKRGQAKTLSDLPKLNT